MQQICKLGDREAQHLLVLPARTHCFVGLTSLICRKKPDDTEPIDILQSLPSNDGKKAPLTLYRGEPVYFRFAELKNTGIVVPTVGQTGRHVGQEAVVKLSISGPDVPFAAIRLHLTVAGSIIDIKEWERPEPRQVPS